jgi:hypothetical protein
MAALLLLCFVPPILVVSGKEHSLPALVVSGALALVSIVLQFRGEDRG